MNVQNDLLVNTEWLENNIFNDSVRLIDCGYPDAYERAHLPGAVGLEDNYLKNSAFGNLHIATAKQIQTLLESFGVSNEMQIIVYDNRAGVYASRFWWVLAYYGYYNVKVLDGGWEKWIQENRKIESKIPIYSPSKFNIPLPEGDQTLIARKDHVIEVCEDNRTVIWDCRSKQEYYGTETRGNKRLGHMPNAQNLEWSNMVNRPGNDTFRNRKDILHALSRINIKDKQTNVITYCQAGIRAAHAMFVLKLMGFEKVKNYDGSWKEWGNVDDTPII